MASQTIMEKSCLLAFLLLTVSTGLVSPREDNCDVQIYVSDSSTVKECQLTELSALDDMYYECSSLEDALILASHNITSENCTKILLRGGTYTVRYTYSFNQSVVLLCQSQNVARVIFNVSSVILSSLKQFQPLYVLQFNDVEYVSIRGIEFDGAPGIIGIRRVASIRIQDCSFRYFFEGAIDILNSFEIMIINCTFNNCGPVTDTLKNQFYSIHSGGVSITIDSLSERNDVESIINITESTFYNNSALPTPELTRSTNDIFTRNIFTGRGGGLGITLNSPNKSVKAYITDCTFIKNRALVWGGGIYIVFGPMSNHTVIVEGSSFIENDSGYGGGGLFSSTVDSTTNIAFSSLFVKKSSFIGNTAFQGGAIVNPSPGRPGFSSAQIFTSARFENCNFTRNKAVHISAIALVTLDTFSSQHRSPIEIVNCTFSNNEAVDSPALSALYVPVTLDGVIVFDSNTGGAIEVVHAIAFVKGFLKISNTTTVGTNGGAFQLNSFGQIMLHRGAEIVFVNNTGSLGAALISETQRLLTSFTQLLYNPLCFLLYEDIRITPNQWKDVKMIFSGNKAIVGAAAYTELLYPCSWSQLKDPFFKTEEVLKWNFINYGVNTNTFHDTNKTDSQWYVQTSAVGIDSLEKIVTTYPGEIFQLNLSVVDELNEPVAAPLRVLESSQRNDVLMQPAVSFYTNESELPIKQVILRTGANTNGMYDLTIYNVFNLEATTVSNFSIKLRDCPPGFILTPVESSSDFMKCTCNFDNQDIITCSNKGPMFQESYWATTDSSNNDGLALYHCPTQYCRCFTTRDSPTECIYAYNLETPDAQCNCNRKGVLCGECRNGKGVSALLNKCTTCHDAFSILIVTLVLIDICIMIVILRFYLSTDYPSLLFPCIFYIQFLPYGVEVFQNEFANIKPYLQYVGSALGLYFPYDFCLYSNASPVATHAFKLIPIALALVITPIMLAVIWKFLRLKANGNWTSVWLLLVVLYPQAVHTSLVALNCPRISVNGTTDSRWFIDGSVLCFRDKHALLGIFSILILSICVAAIPVTLLLSIKKFENIRWLHRLQSALHVWFKKEYKWWYCIELGRRLLLLLMVVPFPGNQYPVFITYCITMGLFLYLQPYAMPAANWLEFIFSVVTFLIYVLLIPRLPIYSEETTYVTENGRCSEEIQRYSVVSVLGVVLYYSVLLVSSISLIIWASMTILPKMKKRFLTRKKSKGISSDIRPHAISEAIEIESKATTYLRMTNHGIWKLHGQASQHSNASSSVKSCHGNSITDKLSDAQEKSTELV